MPKYNEEGFAFVVGTLDGFNDFGRYMSLDEASEAQRIAVRQSAENIFIRRCSERSVELDSWMVGRSQP